MDGRTNIIPKMGLEALQKGYRMVLEHLYSPRNYYARVRTFLSEYKPTRIRVQLNFEYILALFRSILRLGIIGRERIYYLRLFFWALFKRPRLFPLAINFTILGFHFRRVCDLHIH